VSGNQYYIGLQKLLMSGNEIVEIGAAHLLFSFDQELDVYGSFPSDFKVSFDTFWKFISTWPLVVYRTARKKFSPSRDGRIKGLETHNQADQTGCTS